MMMAVFIILSVWSLYDYMGEESTCSDGDEASASPASATPTQASTLANVFRTIMCMTGSTFAVGILMTLRSLPVYNEEADDDDAYQ